MNELSPSIWQQDENGEWKLYFNTDIKLNSSLNKNSEQIRTKAKANNNNLSQKNLVLGTLVMTKKGIGRLIKINKDIVIIKFKNDTKEEKININEISNNFNCFIYDYIDGNINIIKLKLNVLGKIDNIFEELEKINKINRNKCNYSLIFKGKIVKKDFTYEELDILNNSKFLLLKEDKVKYTVTRFLAISQYWLITAEDSICFSPSQKIKLVGVGLYGSHQNKIIDSTIKILEGSEFSDKIIHEENVEISPAISKLFPISQIYFSKPIICKQNQDYCIILNSKTTTNSYFGRQGKNLVEGEKGVNFSFKKMRGGRNGGTSPESGNFPELYYCI